MPKKLPFCLCHIPTNKLVLFAKTKKELELALKNCVLYLAEGNVYVSGKDKTAFDKVDFHPFAKKQVLILDTSEFFIRRLCQSEYETYYIPYKKGMKECLSHISNYIETLRRKNVFNPE